MGESERIEKILCKLDSIPDVDLIVLPGKVATRAFTMFSQKYSQEEGKRPFRRMPTGSREKIGLSRKVVFFC